CTLNEEFDELRLVSIHGNANGEVYAKLIVNHAIPTIQHLVSDEQEVLEQAGIPQEVERRLYNSLNKPTNIDNLEEKVIAVWYSIPSQYYHRV
ncbi:19076_t:CDS:2, partial [Cetraspora pellucida]